MHKSWIAALQPEFDKDYYKKVKASLVGCVFVAFVLFAHISHVAADEIPRKRAR
jgi:hypothetical protein